MLELLGREKINGVPNVELLLVITVTATDHTVIGFLVDDGSSCNVLYPDALEKLGLCQ